MRTFNTDTTTQRVAHARIRRMDIKKPLQTHAYVVGTDEIGFAIGNPCTVISCTSSGEDFLERFEGLLAQGYINQVHCGAEVPLFDRLEELARRLSVSFDVCDKPKGQPHKRMRKMWRLGFPVMSQCEADALWLFHAGDAGRSELMDPVEWRS